MNYIRQCFIKQHFSKKNLYIRSGLYFNRNKWTLNKIKISFVIIGAQKSGTTSLYKYLDEHPDIFMSKPIKEPGYFMFSNYLKNYFNNLDIHISNKNDLLKNYMIQGYNPSQIFGEASTYYTIGNHAKNYEIAKKMYSHNKKMKLIYLIRHPFHRIYSNYKHFIKNNHSIEFSQWLNEHPMAIETSKYAYQVNHYLSFFKSENIKIICFEEFTANPQAIMDELYTFLEVKKFKHTAFKQHNKSISLNLEDSILRNKYLKKTQTEFYEDTLQLLKKFKCNALNYWDL